MRDVHFRFILLLRKPIQPQSPQIALRRLWLFCLSIPNPAEEDNGNYPLPPCHGDIDLAGVGYGVAVGVSDGAGYCCTAEPRFVAVTLPLLSTVATFVFDE